MTERSEYMKRAEIYRRLSEAAEKHAAQGRAAFDEGDAESALYETCAAAGLRQFRDELEAEFKDAPWNS